MTSQQRPRRSTSCGTVTATATATATGSEIEPETEAGAGAEAKAGSGHRNCGTYVTKCEARKRVENGTEKEYRER